MNAFMYVLIFLGVVCLWFLLNGLFKLIGGFIQSIWKKTKENIKGE